MHLRRREGEKVTSRLTHLGRWGNGHSVRRFTATLTQTRIVEPSRCASVFVPSSFAWHGVRERSNRWQIRRLNRRHQ